MKPPRLTAAADVLPAPSKLPLLASSELAGVSEPASTKLLPDPRPAIGLPSAADAANVNVARLPITSEV